MIVAALALLAGGLLAPGEPELPRGRVVDPVVSSSDSQQSYALYLPSGYTPEGFCAGAYHSLFPVLYAWTFGAQFPFADSEGQIKTTCPDGGKLTFKVRKIEE